MKKFLLGFIIGAAILWLYGAYVLAPKAAQQGRSELAQEIEAEKINQELFIAGTVTGVDATTGNVMVETVSALDSPTDDAVVITVTTDANTSLKTASGEPMGITSLINGSRVTVVSNEAVGNKTTIYAKEIIQF